MPSIFDELSDDTTIEPKHESSTLMDKPDMIPQLEDLQVPAPAAAKKKCGWHQKQQASGKT